jgi:hypothetical protein
LPVAFVLGNGNSRATIPLDSLKQHGVIYGCNALYRDFSPDWLVAVDEGVIDEINSSNFPKESTLFPRSKAEEYEPADMHPGRNRYPRNPIQIFPDPAGVQRKTSANGNTDIKLLENAGFQVRYHRQHPLVKDRINSANSLFFLRDDNTTKFYIDARCKHTIKSLQQFCYKEDTQIPDKDSGFDHMFDALTYAIQFLFPINKDVERVAPRAFGHQLA